MVSINAVDGETAAADVFRVFLQVAKALKDSEYRSVELACKDVSKFSIDGAYFKQLGQEYGEQNAIYTIRTFPAKTTPLDGGRSYEAWSGGLLAVVGKQMEDFNDLHQRWYIADLTSAAK